MRFKLFKYERRDDAPVDIGVETIDSNMPMHGGPYVGRARGITPMGENIELTWHCKARQISLAFTERETEVVIEQLQKTLDEVRELRA